MSPNHIAAMALALALLTSVSAIAQAEPPIRPDPNLTPGATLTVGPEQICQPGYSKRARYVNADTKRRVFREYGLIEVANDPHLRRAYEVDHLISLELGGSNDITNLWPQSYRTKPWNARVKDRLENFLHAEVCAGRIPLRRAQQEIATDWIAAYERYLGQPEEPRRARRYQ